LEIDVENHICYLELSLLTQKTDRPKTNSGGPIKTHFISLHNPLRQRYIVNRKRWVLQSRQTNWYMYWKLIFMRLYH